MSAPTIAPSAERRRERLLATIHRVGGRWSTCRAMRLYRELGLAPCRKTARDDLKYLAARGLLTQDDTGNDRTFTLPATGGTQ